MDGAVVVVVSGPSGSGKSTVARLLAERTGWKFAEGDDFHPPSNVAKMRAGTPLEDTDRAVWLAGIRRWIAGRQSGGESGVVTCSCLRRTHRDLLAAGRPSVRFLQLTVSVPVLERRMRERAGHFFPAALLPSQLAELEPLGPDEPGCAVDADGPAAAVVEQVLRAL